MTVFSVRVLSRPCDACPFKGRIDLRSGRLRSIVMQTLRDDTHFSCHRTLVGPDGEYPFYDLDRNAICAGWLEAMGGIHQAPGQMIRMADRMNLLLEVDPDE